MTQRSASVVVDARDWEGELGELARRIMPVTRRPPGQVAPLLERGPVTIEADLSVEEAERLRARLATLGVHARVMCDGKPLAPGAADEQRRPLSAATPADSPPPETPARHTAQDWEDFAELDVQEVEAAGWDEIFSSLEVVPKVDTGAEAAQAAHEQEAAQAAHEQEATLDFGATYDDSVPDVDFGAQPAPRAPRAASPTPAGEARRGFDGLRVAQALDETARAPYAPEGFDDRIEHVPAFAAALSLLAPGAGQIYNGEEERVRELCVQAALVRPWWRSVRQAQEQAEKIRTYWAPRPAPGALGRALRHVALCWLVAGLSIGGLSWAGTAIYRLASQPGAPTMERTQVHEVLQAAHQHTARAYLGAQAQAARPAEPPAPVQRFTMSDEERAQRLFLRGYSYCESGEFSTCASAMKRVSVLSQELRRKAILLQAWASMRHQGNSAEPMPDVGPVESLSVYERQMLELEVSADEGAP